ncbi:plant cysteine oxidase 3 isoform X2 [Tripterygium wilfordii]|uniref:plant cysteine oxidase 3 isoform X2 n=1 Tax=Tripterygium wilfordii TaxID=458696 RepID=UPI0018F7FDC6|nr:plant cysteine oxidase 3 isoform X2 [Tripterygium wilfordii]
MLSKLQRATDKARLFLQIKNQALSTLFFTRHVSMGNTSPSKVQALYELCKTSFTPSGSPPPSSHAIQKIYSLLDTVHPVDFGLKEDNPDDDRGHGCFGLNQLNWTARWAQPITFLDIYECDSLTMCIFCFPTASVIPLHDHPGMTVFSKILYGSLHVKAYDWVEPAKILESKGPGNRGARLAKLAGDDVLTVESGTSVLYPKTGGNLHCFTAITPCAVLDILTPPYSEEAGRLCTYYHDYPYSTFGKGAAIGEGEEEDYAWLVEIETPDLYMRQGTYIGPRVV